MPIESSLLGTATAPIATEVDARWTMAYAAGIGDDLPIYMDMRRPDGIVAHPLFPVCIEWPAACSIRHRARAKLSQDEAARGVHATQHMILHRPIRPPERLTTTAEIIGIERRRPGAYQVVKFETIDDRGESVCTTYSGNLYLRVEVHGADRPANAPKTPEFSAAGNPRGEVTVPIAAGAAHVYTECARIWNPIHTDTAVAARAGLPGLILHGTATLAMALSRIVEAEAGGDPARVAEIFARFGAMVLMPSEVVVRIHGREKTDRGDAISFEVLSADGGRAIRDGVVLLRG
jgi:acyl dehydratase